ncbi:MAG TPA: calcium-binding protein, partial [Allosphingosinicella sp.]
MTASRELTLAILALDSYNREYERNVKVTGTSLGNADLLEREAFNISDTTFEAWKAAGFYASVYDMTGVADFADGETVISYRGTNFSFTLLSFFNSPFWHDASRGWSVGGGFIGGQAALALDFFNAVVPNGTDPRETNITTTGHSLGGGLAGLVANIYNGPATIFDHMPYAPASVTLKVFAETSQETRDRYYGGQAPWDQSSLLIDAYSTENEALSYLRLNAISGASKAISSHSDNQNAVALHSMAMLVSLIWARDHGETDWFRTGNYLWNAFGDTAVADAVTGIDALKGELGANSAVLQAAIAYSAIDEGDGSDKPFGDTGIWSMFNDAGDLGQVLDGGESSFFRKTVSYNPSLSLTGFSIGRKDVRQYLADALVQYAAALAVYDREDGSTGDVDVREGVLTLTPDILVFDASNKLWNEALGRGARLDPLDIGKFRDAYFTQADEHWWTNLGRWVGIGTQEDLARFGWGAQNAAIFNRFHMLRKDGSGDIDLVDRPYDNPPTRGNDANVDVFAGTGSADKVKGTDGHDLILGGAGADDIDTGDGDDMIDGGSGDDTIKGGTGRNILLGGDGSGDKVEYDAFGGTRGLTLNVLIAPDLSAEGADFLTDIKAQARITGTVGGKALRDTFIGVEKLTLTDKADTLNVSKEGFGWLADTLTIDMRNRAGGNLTSADFDTVNYAARGDGTDGVFWINGATQTGLEGVGATIRAVSYTVTAVSALQALIKSGRNVAKSPILAAIQAAAGIKKANERGVEAIETMLKLEDTLIPDDPVVIKGVENINLSNRDDRLYFEGDEHGYEFHSGYGRINAGAGDDIIYYEDGLYQGGDRQLIIDGGTGADWIVAEEGQKVVTAGGLGRDWIMNTSAGGELYGDYYGGLNPDGDPAPDTSENADNFWYWADTTIMDAQHFDVLKYFGMGLTGGDANGGVAGLAIMNGLFGAAIGMANITRYMTGQAQDWTGEVYIDHIQPWIIYTFKRDEDGNLDMYITNAFEQIFRGFMAAVGLEAGQTSQSIHKGWMKVENVDVIGSRLGILQADLTADLFAGKGQGDLSMIFRAVNPLQALLPVINLVPGLIGAALYYTVFADAVISTASAAARFAKSMLWAAGVDPLVIDLDGDGIETISREYSQTYFDVDGDLFRERTGWLKGDDGFLVLDSNGNGRVDGIAELFGDRAQGGFAELSTLDSNGDGKITASDLVWGKLQIWQDSDRDGETDAGELKSLESLGIVSLSLSSTPLNVSTPQNATLLSRSDVTFADGHTTKMFEAIFGANEVDTKFAGEAGFAPWQSNGSLNAKGFGTITDLAVAAANDPEFAELAQARATAMTVPKIKALVAQAGDVLGQWGMTLETSRELAAVRLGATGTMLDRAIYVEDQAGGYWTLRSGAPVKDSAGVAIARPTLEQVLAQGGGWRLEQAWSPATRGDALTKRDEAPYLMRIENGRAVILDYGVKQPDGRWALASAPGITYATAEAILALPHAAGTEWRREDIQFNPLADLPVEAIGVRFTDGKVVDYTVQVTDRDGTFYVWARNLDRALELEWKTGDYREFALRNYEVDFEHLDEVGSTDDSTYRVELLTPAQFHFATSLGGIDFHPQMLTAVANDVTGHLAYTVNDSGRASLSADSYVSSIKTMISMLQPVMEQYVTVSRRFAVRMALQGGLAQFARGIAFDAGRNVFLATTDRQMAPMFEAIFAGAPASNAGDAVLDYLTDWNELLWQIYPDFAPKDDGGVLKGKVGIDQAYIMQMLIQAYENVGVDLDIRGVAHALSVDETRIRTHLATDTQLVGTGGTDFFYMTAGDQTVTGGMAADYYFVGKNSGNDYIVDKDLGGDDELRFTDVSSKDVKAIRDGQDLILEIRGRTNFVRLTDQFLGELNEYSMSGKQFQSGVESIVFSDGVVWDRFRMAIEVVDYQRAEGLFNDPLTGSGSADVLMGGKGNDFLSGNVGGDIYVFRRGDGQDVINDLGGFSFGPVKAGLDFLQFRGNITANDLYLIRDGASENLKLYIRDENGKINRNAAGQITNDGIEIVGQFGGVRLNMGAFGEALGSSDGLDYIAPNLIERFIFGDGTSLEFTEIVAKVLENARTAGDDAIYGLLNNNTLDGGAGDDYLTGREGADTYKFGRNYGQDVVEDADFSMALFGPKDDFLEFTDDLRWTDFDFLRTGKSDTLTLQVKGTTDQLILKDYLKELFLVGYINLVETITFADGTAWSYLKLLQHYVDIAKTAGNDTIYGFEGISDSIDGGLGNDRLEGLSGNDRYVFGRNYGTDTILDESGTERLQFNGIASTEITFSRTALDLIMTVTATGERIVLENQYVRDDQQHFAVEYFEFGDRTLVFTDFNPEDMDLVGTNAGEEITGSNFAETLDGLGGNDTLIGGDGGDTYKFDVGYGQDVIVDRRIRAYWSDRPGFRVPVNDVVK